MKEIKLSPLDVMRLFQLSVVNGADNLQNYLPINHGWKWPRDTWLQTRLEQKRMASEGKERGDDE